MKQPFDRLAEAIVSLKQPAKITAFLQELLTPNEVHDLGLRWELVELLAEGMSQRNIATKLGISLCKITRGAKILKKRNGVVAGLIAREPEGKKPVLKGKVVRKSTPSEKSATVGKGRKHGSRIPRKS